jgi:hypothetical protein
MTTTTQSNKSKKQEEVEKLEKAASENVRLAKKIMENMTRRRRIAKPMQPHIAYEKR